jgi:hypothetical protein
MGKIYLTLAYMWRGACTKNIVMPFLRATNAKIAS